MPRVAERPNPVGAALRTVAFPLDSRVPTRLASVLNKLERR